MQFPQLITFVAWAVAVAATPLAGRDESDASPTVFRFLGTVYCTVNSTVPDSKPCPPEDPYTTISPPWSGIVLGRTVTVETKYAYQYSRYNVFVDGALQNFRNGDHPEALFGSHIYRSYDYDLVNLNPTPADYVSPYPDAPPA